MHFAVGRLFIYLADTSLVCDKLNIRSEKNAVAQMSLKDRQVSNKNVQFCTIREA